MSVLRNGLLRLMAIFVALGCASTSWAAAVPSFQDFERATTPEEVAKAEVLLGVVRDICIPVALGAKLEDTPGYAALGRPPIVGVFEVAPYPKTLVTPAVSDLEISSDRVCSFRPEAFAPGLMAAVFASDPHWTRMPALSGIDELFFNTGTGLTIRWDRYGLHVSRPEGSLEALRTYHASMVAAPSRNRIEALMGAIKACPAYLKHEANYRDGIVDDMDPLDVHTEGAAYGTFPRVRGDIKAVLTPINLGCAIVFEAAPALLFELSAALSGPDSGWTPDGRGAWRMYLDESDPGTDSLFIDVCENRFNIVYSTGDYLDFRSRGGNLSWRPCAIDAMPLPDSGVYGPAG